MIKISTITPPLHNNVNKKNRSSNLEMYRIVCMLMIIAHHFVVNSGLTSVDGPILTNPTGIKTLFLWMFGMWGKTGINCFLMITGYFMCKAEITLKKFLKLVLEIYLYKFIFFGIFFATGYESFSLSRVVKLLMPFWGFSNDFVGCFLVFYLTIPFWNILIRNMTKKQHQLLLVLLLCMYSVLGSVPKFHISFNYVTWFGVIYLLSSYIRLYPSKIFEKKKLWGLLTILFVLLGIASMFVMQFFMKSGGQYFVADSNKFLAVAVAVSSFLYFKNIKIPYSKIINTIGASTFGVLLIHANSNAMRTWLWKDVVDCVGNYSLSLGSLIMYAIVSVLIIFLVCTLIDILRIRFIETPFFNWFDKKNINIESLWQIKKQ